MVALSGARLAKAHDWGCFAAGGCATRRMETMTKVTGTRIKDHTR